MKTLIWTLIVATVLVGCGLIYAHANASAVEFVCPLTGEVLPCPCCCPLNR